MKFSVSIIKLLLLGLFTCSTYGDVPTFEITSLPENPDDALDKSSHFHRAAIDDFENRNFENALTLLQKALDITPKDPQLLNTIGVVLKSTGQVDRSIDFFRASLELDPDGFHQNYNVGNLLHYDLYTKDPNNVSILDESFLYYDKALQKVWNDEAISDSNEEISKKHKVDFLNDVSIALRKRQRHQEVIRLLSRAVDVDPRNFQARGNLALTYLDLGDIKNSFDQSTIAIELDPKNVLLRHNHAVLLHIAGNDDEAQKEWLKVVDLKSPECISAFTNLGHDQLQRKNRPAARYFYQLAYDAMLKEDPTTIYGGETFGSIVMHLAMSILPEMYSSTDEIRESREAYDNNLNVLLNEGSGMSIINDPYSVARSSYYGVFLRHQGFKDDVSLRRRLAMIYWKYAPSLRYIAPFLLETNKDGNTVINDKVKTMPDGRIRIGFHGAFLYDHPVGRLIEGVIASIDKKKFHVTVFFQNSHKIPVDEVSDRIRSNSDSVVFVPSILSQAQNIIALEQIDVLVYTETIMDPMSFLLPFSRLAKRTVSFMAFPESSGILTKDGAALTGIPQSAVGGIDYVVASTLFTKNDEPIQDYFVESVYSMQSLTTFMRHSNEPSPDKTLSSFGIPEGHNIYFTPQDLTSIHPVFDDMVLEILNSDMDAIVVFYNTPSADMNDMFRKRMVERSEQLTKDQELQQNLLSRILRLDYTSFQDALALAKLANVILEPFSTGFHELSFHLFSTGTPIVTHYNRAPVVYMTHGLYKHMNIMDCVAYSDDEYLSISTKIGRDREMERRIRNSIMEKKNSLFESKAVIDEWNFFLYDIAAADRPYR